MIISFGMSKFLPNTAPRQTVAMAEQPSATFYFDLGSPYAYLSAERVDGLIANVHWQPILLGGLFRRNGRSSWARGDQVTREEGMAEIERRAERYGLAPTRWPDSWPSDYLFAMRAATFAFKAGGGREFVLQAFRSAFQHGVDLSVPANVLEQATPAGLEPGAMEAATQDPEIKLALREATDAAHERGVFGVPTVAVGDELLWGDDRLEDAVALARGSSG
jgi:2-hydroxychromene-2-carboxylate isomerase